MTTAVKEAPKNNGEVTAKKEKSVVEFVADKMRYFMERGELDLPKNYSPENALKSAWLTLQGIVNKDKQPVLTSCTRDSIAVALLDMIVQGLNPMKKQCYFIAYGKKLLCQRSYFGAMAIAQMVNPEIDEFTYAIVYEEDTFKYSLLKGKKVVTEHTQEFGNVDKKKIVGAYCIALDKKGEPMRTEIMTFDEIKTAWTKSQTKPVLKDGSLETGSTHEQFTADMALKTVINKCCKVIINASSDNALLLDRVNRSAEIADAAMVEEEIGMVANSGEMLGIDGPQDTIDITAEKPGDIEIKEPTEAEMQKQTDEATKGLKETNSRKPSF